MNRTLIFTPTLYRANEIVHIEDETEGQCDAPKGELFAELFARALFVLDGYRGLAQGGTHEAVLLHVGHAAGPKRRLSSVRPPVPG